VETNATCDIFNSLNWHDSRLIGFSLFPSADGKSHELYFDIDFISIDDAKSIVWIHKKLILLDCTIAKIDLDLEGKKICSDSIAVAFCYKNSSYKHKIETEQLKGEENPLENYYHFCIQLINPGGVFNVFAKNYEMMDRL
jgi:hypothetical protein